MWKAANMPKGCASSSKATSTSPLVRELWKLNNCKWRLYKLGWFNENVRFLNRVTSTQCQEMEERNSWATRRDRSWSSVCCYRWVRTGLQQELLRQENTDGRVWEAGTFFFSNYLLCHLLGDFFFFFFFFFWFTLLGCSTTVFVFPCRFKLHASFRNQCFFTRGMLSVRWTRSWTNTKPCCPQWLSTASPDQGKKLSSTLEWGTTSESLVSFHQFSSC